jgi:hypothetical protein
VASMLAKRKIVDRFFGVVVANQMNATVLYWGCTDWIFRDFGFSHVCCVVSSIQQRSCFFVIYIDYNNGRGKGC